MPDSVPLLSTGSGTTFIGFGYNLIFSSRLRLHFQPGIGFLRLTFDQQPQKKFPVAGDTTFILERFRLTYVQLPIQLAIILKRNEEAKVLTKIELGPVVGVLLNASQKFKQSLSGGIRRTLTLKYSFLPNPYRWFYGVQASFYYRWIGFFAFYRLSPLFKAGSQYENPRGEVLGYPRFSSFSLGFQIVL